MAEDYLVNKTLSLWKQQAPCVAMKQVTGGAFIFLCIVSNVSAIKINVHVSMNKCFFPLRFTFKA
jgi:hypothetical protein